jgi:CheY-like chemotaxis protein
MCADKKTLLVVDDDAVIRDSLADLLADEGYSVITAIDGADALKKLRDGMPTPCVILLDLMMPIMSGGEFYQAQQADPMLADIPVVVISADGNVKNKAQSFGGEYLAKPVKIDTVLSTVDRLCV